jgi:pimeloyl-ACP methyl ester carboxylesterase
MSAITVDGELVHYEVLGRGRPVVLLHGWIGSWRYWIPTMRHLQFRHRVYAIDLFGYGDSGKNPQKYTLFHQIILLEDFMRQLGIPKAAFIAHGLGVQVLLEFAAQHPERVARMLLIAAPLFNPGDLDTRIPAGHQVLLKHDTNTMTAISSVADTTQPKHVNKMSVKFPSKMFGDFDDTAVSTANMIDANIMYQNALSRSAKTAKDEEAPPHLTPDLANKGYVQVNKDNPLSKVLAHGPESLLARCFKRSGTDHNKFMSDISKSDRSIVEHCGDEFDAGKLLDAIRILDIPTVIVHGKDDPIIPMPSDDIWDYLSVDKNELLIVPLDGTHHFPMIGNNLFQRLITQFLETFSVSKIEVTERWRRRSR